MNYTDNSNIKYTALVTYDKSLNNEKNLKKKKIGIASDGKEEGYELPQEKIKELKLEDNNEIKLEGVVFDVLDSNNNIVDTITTNSNGEAITKKLPIDQNYKIIEKQTQKEYVLSTKTPVVTLKENEITSLTFTNRKIKGYLEITKVNLKDKKKK
mgnify:CR=1 FL=1